MEIAAATSTTAVQQEAFIRAPNDLKLDLPCSRDATAKGSFIEGQHAKHRQRGLTTVNCAVGTIAHTRGPGTHRGCRKKFRTSLRNSISCSLSCASAVARPACTSLSAAI